MHTMRDSGLIIVDKPQGVTSHDIVAACRSLLHTSKVGHAGTLDPMATGVLVIGYGSATRLLNALTHADKTYMTTIYLGASTVTDDAEGQIIELSEREAQKVFQRVRSLTALEIERAVEQFVGDIKQVPSTYSAIKVNGQRAYDLARQGQDVQLDARPVHISEFTVLDIRHIEETDTSNEHWEVDARITCSAGTYIRSLGRDLGNALGVGGYLTALRRERVGQFEVNDSRTISASTKAFEYTDRAGQKARRIKAVFAQELHDDREALAACVISMDEAVRGVMPVVKLTARQAVDISFGRPIKMNVPMAAAVVWNGHLIALTEPWKRGLIKPSTVFVTAQDLTNGLMQGSTLGSADGLRQNIAQNTPAHE